MTQDRDDIVIRPSLNPRAGHARRRAREHRRIDRVKRKNSFLRRWMERIKRRRALRRLQEFQDTRRAISAARGLRDVAGSVEEVAGRGALAAEGGIGGFAAGAVVVGIVVATVVALRLLSGRSFENMGAQVNKMLLGDMDDEARAALAARHYLENQPNLLRSVALQHGVSSDVHSVFKDLLEINRRKEIGRSQFMEDKAFQANGFIDQLILRARDLVLSAFRSSGGPGYIRDLKKVLHPETEGNSPRGGR